MLNSHINYPNDPTDCYAEKIVLSRTPSSFPSEIQDVAAVTKSTSTAILRCQTE